MHDVPIYVRFMFMINCKLVLCVTRTFDHWFIKPYPYHYTIALCNLKIYLTISFRQPPRPNSPVLQVEDADNDDELTLPQIALRDRLLDDCFVTLSKMASHLRLVEHRCDSANRLLKGLVHWSVCEWPGAIDANDRSDFDTRPPNRSARAILATMCAADGSEAGKNKGVRIWRICGVSFKFLVSTIQLAEKISGGPIQPKK